LAEAHGHQIRRLGVDRHLVGAAGKQRALEFGFVIAGQQPTVPVIVATGIAGLEGREKRLDRRPRRAVILRPYVRERGAGQAPVRDCAPQPVRPERAIVGLALEAPAGAQESGQRLALAVLGPAGQFGKGHLGQQQPGRRLRRRFLLAGGEQAEDGRQYQR